jgi:integral membrane sensor domain MASE1
MMPGILIHPDNAVDGSKRVTVQIAHASRSDELKVIVVSMVSMILLMLCLLPNDFIFILDQLLRLLGLELLHCLCERHAQDLASPAWTALGIVRVGVFIGRRVRRMHQLFSDIATEGLDDSSGFLVDVPLVVVVFEFSDAELLVGDNMTRQKHLQMVYRHDRTHTVVLWVVKTLSLGWAFTVCPFMLLVLASLRFFGRAAEVGDAELAFSRHGRGYS